MPAWIDATKLLWLAVGALLGAFGALLTLFVILVRRDHEIWRGVEPAPRPPAPPDRRSQWPPRW